MGGYDIGISGFRAAQKALNIIGNNLANAATDGYHRQKLDLRPIDDAFTNGIYIGQGVDSKNVVRLVSTFLDDEIIRQDSTMTQIIRELESLQTMESAFGELMTGGLSTMIDNFFNSMQDLSANPTDANYQHSVISSAEALANQLRSLGTTINKMEEQIYIEAQTIISDVNALTEQIGDLNKEISFFTVQGHDVNNMLDQRDHLITELSRLVGITTHTRDFNVVDIVAADVTLVSGAQFTELEVGMVRNGNDYDLGIRAVGSSSYRTNITGGKLGGLFNLRNNIVRSIGNDLDMLAKTIVNETNKIHVQGVGKSGSFTALTGWTMASGDVSDFDPPIVDGEKIYVRIIDSGGIVRRYEIDIDAVNDTLTTVAAKFEAITGLSSSVISNKLTISADSGYTFDFLPGVLADPMADTLTTPPDPPNYTLSGAVPDINISGDYTGTSTLTYTLTVLGTGPIGAGTLQIDVNDGSGTVATLDLGNVVGSEYVAGSVINVADGIKISFGSGTLNVGEIFKISTVANSDASGFLAATGINSFFSGTTAASMGVTDFVSDSVTGIGRIAVHKSAVTRTDNGNVSAMANLGDTSLSALGNFTLKEYYRDLATDVGSQVSTTQARHDNINGIWRSLTQQRSEISGVDMNDEATKMLVFEQMFQAMAKFINTVAKSMDAVMSILR